MAEDPGEEGVEAAGRAFRKGSRWWEVPEVCGTWAEDREKPQSRDPTAGEAGGPGFKSCFFIHWLCKQGHVPGPP